MSNFDERPQYIEVAHIAKKCYTYLELFNHKDGAVCVCTNLQVTFTVIRGYDEK